VGETLFARMRWQAMAGAARAAPALAPQASLVAVRREPGRPTRRDVRDWQAIEKGAGHAFGRRRPCSLNSPKSEALASSSHRVAMHQWDARGNVGRIQ